MKLRFEAPSPIRLNCYRWTEAGLLNTVACALVGGLCLEERWSLDCWGWEKAFQTWAISDVWITKPGPRQATGGSLWGQQASWTCQPQIEAGGDGKKQCSPKKLIFSFVLVEEVPTSVCVYWETSSLIGLLPHIPRFRRTASDSMYVMQISHHTVIYFEPSPADPVPSTLKLCILKA